MKYTSIIVAALLTVTSTHKLRQEEAPEFNQNYLSTMTLTHWKVYNDDERFSMYKESESEVNRMEALLAQLELDNVTNLSALDDARLGLEDAKKDK